MEGLLGLSNNIQTTDSAIRDLSVLERMDQRMEQDRQKEMAAQAYEQKAYEQAYQMSDKLLEKDRIRINKRIAKSQEMIQDHFRKSGGSRARFLEQGGLRVVGDLTNDIMRSDEAVRYQENKTNLARIIAAKDAGKTHLINPKDLASAEDYENNEEGAKITYTGLMNEVEIPPANQTDYGTKIDPMRVLGFSANRAKITANFLAVKNRPEGYVPNEGELLNFIDEQGYGGYGSNTANMQIAARRSKSSSGSMGKRKNTLTGQAVNLSKDLNTIWKRHGDKINLEYGGNINAYLQDNKEMGGKYFTNTTEISNPLMGRNRTTLDAEGFQFGLPQSDTVDYFREDMVSLRGARSAFNGLEGDIAKEIMGHEVVNGKIMNYKPTREDFKVNGQKVKVDLDKGEFTGNYNLEGIVLASNYQDKEGNESLVVDFHDDNGKLDESETQKIRDGEGKNKSVGYYIAMSKGTGEAKDVFYRKIDTNNLPQLQVLQSAIPNNDVSGTVQEQQQDDMAQQYIDFEQKKRKQQTQAVISAYDQPVFSSEQNQEFEDEGWQYASSNGQDNRNDLMKAFYMARSYASNPDENPNPEVMKQQIQNNEFTSAMGLDESGYKNLRNYNKYSDDEIITNYFENISRGEDPQTIQNNQIFAKTWKDLLSFYQNQ